MEEEFTTEMHYELLSKEITKSDMQIMGVYGAISRGVSKKTALQKYKISAELYDSNIKRVLRE